MNTRLLPDIEAALVTYLLTVPELTDEVGSRVWGSAHRPEGPAFPFLELTLISGRPDTEHWLGHGLIQVAGWSNRRLALAPQTARDVCETAVAALHDLRNTEIGDCLVTSVEDSLGVRPLPDPVTSNPRYMADVLVHYHPALGS